MKREAWNPGSHLPPRAGRAEWTYRNDPGQTGKLPSHTGEVGIPFFNRLQHWSISFGGGWLKGTLLRCAEQFVWWQTFWLGDKGLSFINFSSSISGMNNFCFIKIKKIKLLIYHTFQKKGQKCISWWIFIKWTHPCNQNLVRETKYDQFFKSLLPCTLFSAPTFAKVTTILTSNSVD